jgi:hypothetical protein
LCRELRRMMDICERMEVVDANDQHVAIVEKVEGDRIKLVKSDALDPRHSFIEKSQTADHNKVGLSRKISAITTRAFVSPERFEEIVVKKIKSYPGRGGH